MKYKTLKRSWPVFLLVLSSILISCSSQPTSTPIETLPETQSSGLPPVALTSTPEPPPPRVLTICLGDEPGSLFLYGDASVAARNVRQAIYDGPYDILNFEVQPVILEDVPSLANGLVALQPVLVGPGDLIVDSQGMLTDLSEGTMYLPSGCAGGDCTQTYSGGEGVSMDQLSVKFNLRSDIRWSDGEPLTPSDSVYSYEVARELFPRVRPELIRHTSSYQAVDERMVEWRAVPGYLDATYHTNFFTPLPQHIWGNVSAQDLLAAELSTRLPLGWGPYVIDEWVSGDHISLSKNPNYFRAAGELPQFDRLVYRFLSGSDEVLSALLAGECDLADEISLSEVPVADLLPMQEDGSLNVLFVTGAAWEHADFGIVPSDPEQFSLFQAKELRQAIAMCINRQDIVDQLFFGQSQVPDTYVPAMHPLYASEAKKYIFDPQEAMVLLNSLGWVDGDNDPLTPRVALGVPGIPDGTPLTFTYQTLDGVDRQAVAQIVASSLALCGIQVELSFSDWNTLFAPGPDGSVFGRRFEMVQFAWSSSLEPPCFLYVSDEVPGSYPEYPKGWGGANANGYSNPEFDQACKAARFSLPDMPEHTAAHLQAQTIFAEDLPTIPLYLHVDSVATRPDMCGVSLDPSVGSSLWNLEAYDYGPHCE